MGAVKIPMDKEEFLVLPMRAETLPRIKDLLPIIPPLPEKDRAMLHRNLPVSKRNRNDPIRPRHPLRKRK